jgi:hypothetical protein
VNGPTARIETEADPTPLVLSLARTLRLSLQDPELRKLVSKTTGTVSLKSATDAQAATLTFDGSGVRVSRGVVWGATPLELHSFPEYTIGANSDPLGETAARLLSPPLPSWRDAAAAFVAANEDTHGFPGRLVVVCQDEEAEAVFGDGDDVFEIHGYSPVLSAVLSGQGDAFLFAAAVGFISVVGTGAQMSVMCGAHWKVRFHG